MNFFTRTYVLIYVPKNVSVKIENKQTWYFTLTIHLGREQSHQNSKFRCKRISFGLQCSRHHTKDPHQLDDFLTSWNCIIISKVEICNLLIKNLLRKSHLTKQMVRCLLRPFPKTINFHNLIMESLSCRIFHAFFLIQTSSNFIMNL